MRTQCRFRSAIFKPLAAHANQALLGKELAEWLCAKLPHGFLPDLLDEDWGYRITFGDTSLNAKVTICCGSVEHDQWSFYCQPYRSFIDKLLGRPLPLSEMERVLRACDRLVAEEPGFSEVEWFETDRRFREVNHGSRAFE